MQLLFIGVVCREFTRISTADSMRRCCRRISLKRRTALSVDCTNGGLAVLAFPFQQLLAHMQFALVQLLFLGGICTEFTRISTADSLRRWRRRISLQGRNALCVDCTNGGFAFLASPFPQLLANMQFALVQLLFLGGICREFTRISTAYSMRRWSMRISLQRRTALCVDFTNAAFAVLSSQFPQLLAHMQFALVQLLFLGGTCREFTRISTANSMRRWSMRISLQRRTALCVDFTNAAFAVLSSPFPQLLAHMQFALVQLLFIGVVCREFTRISTADSMRRWCRRISLQRRTALSVDCTNGGLAVLAFPFPQLLAHMQFTLVQLFFRGGICREFTRISTADSMRRWSRRITLQRRTALCVDCTNAAFAVLSSPFPQILAHMQFALVQLLFIGGICREFTRISTADSLRRWSRRISLQRRTALCVDCTNGGLAVLAFPFPQLLAHMQFTLVQLFFRGGICRQFTRLATADSMRRCSRRISFQRRTALCVDCTNAAFALLSSPFPQLLAHMQFALVQLLFLGGICREFT